MIKLTKGFNYVQDDFGGQVHGRVKVIKGEKYFYKTIEGEDSAFVLFSSQEKADNDSSDKSVESVESKHTYSEIEHLDEMLIYIECGDSISDSLVDEFNKCETLLEMIILAENNNGYLAEVI